jgi:tRNA pseudouridine38-40 synthase
MDHGGSTPAARHRYALGVEYDGGAYKGWQIQPHAPSIQQTLNEALSQVADEPVACVGAGRTDTGVHARGQVVHFDTVAVRPARAWVLGLNSLLPDDISVLWAQAVPADFHARYSAVGRSYRYVVLNRPVRSALWLRRAWWVRQPLDAAAMQAAARFLVGEHDFSAFRASACQSASPVRELRRLDVRREGALVVIDCEANAFLHHMVRNMAGSLVRVGKGEAEPGWLGELLADRDRRLAGMTAPPWGLCLTAVAYAGHWGLPEPRPAEADAY